MLSIVFGSEEEELAEGWRRLCSEDLRDLYPPARGIRQEYGG